MRITHEQAIEAFTIVNDLVNQVWPKGTRKDAAAMVLPHETTQRMYELIKEVREQQ
jgi:hypothetical protein